MSSRTVEAWVIAGMPGAELDDWLPLGIIGAMRSLEVDLTDGEHRWCIRLGWRSYSSSGYARVSGRGCDCSASGEAHGADLLRARS